MCWHNWSKWSIIQETDLVRLATIGRERGVIGYVFIQKRTCSKCGFTQYDKQQINSND